MLLTMSSIIMVVIVSFLLILISLILSKKTILDREKSSPFECGFDPKGHARLPFSLRFFLIAVIFLIFDVEVVLLFPLVLTLSKSSFVSWYLTSMFFLMIVILGLYYEWGDGALEWSE